VARLTAAGAPDTSFHGTGELVYSYDLGGAADDSADAVALDGTRIVIGGETSEQASPFAYDLTVTRLNADGSFDTSFNGSGKYMLSFSRGGVSFDSGASAVVVRPDGSLLIGGTVYEADAIPEDGWNFGLLVSLTPAGAADTTFGGDGLALLSSDVGSQLLVQPDGGVLYQSIQTGNQIGHAAGPVPAIVSTSVMTTGAARRARAVGVAITFNTAVDPALARDIKIYPDRRGKATKGIKVKKVSYDAATSTWTVRFAGTTAREGFRIVITPGVIEGEDGEVLFGGATLPVVVASPSASGR
jgi:uncharacterized delta-60 repeat protein